MAEPQATAELSQQPTAIQPASHPPDSYAPPPPPRKRRVGLAVGFLGGVVLVLGGIGVLVTGLLNGNATTNVPSSQTGLNQAIRDGKFEFVVKTIACGKSRVGDTILGKTAQGQFCEILITVRNIGNEPQTFEGGSQQARGANGATYGNDAEAELYVNGGSQTIHNLINPGNTIQGKLVFDIPKGARIVSLELHDSAFSHGVVVNLSAPSGLVLDPGAADYLGIISATTAEFKGLPAYRLVLMPDVGAWAVRGTPKVVVGLASSDPAYNQYSALFFTSGEFVIYIPSSANLPESLFMAPRPGVVLVDTDVL